MTSASFDFAPLLPAGLPQPAARWTGLAKYSFVGGNNDPEQVPLDGLIDAVNAVLKREGRTLATYGLASGPHLDYRVKHGEGWIDPLSLKGVRDEPIPETRLAAFRSWRDELRGGLRNVKLAKTLHLPSVQREGTQLAIADAAPQPSRSGVAR